MQFDREGICGSLKYAKLQQIRGLYTFCNRLYILLLLTPFLRFTLIIKLLLAIIASAKSYVGLPRPSTQRHAPLTPPTFRTTSSRTPIFHFAPIKLASVSKLHIRKGI